MHCDQPMLLVNLWAKETIVSAAAEVLVPNSQQRNQCWCHWYCWRLQEEAGIFSEQRRPPVTPD